MTGESPYRVFGSHLCFAVRLTPKGRRAAVEGWAADTSGRPHLKARVTAPAEEGKANAALIALLAKQLDVAKSCVRIVSGTTARLKSLEVEGNTAALAARLDGLGKRR